MKGQILEMLRQVFLKFHLQALRESSSLMGESFRKKTLRLVQVLLSLLAAQIYHCRRSLGARSFAECQIAPRETRYRKHHYYAYSSWSF